MSAGRPSKYDDKFCRVAYKMALLGATDKDLAEAFDTSEQTVNTWKTKHPEFLESLKKGKEVADANVAKRLYDRAMGYKHQDLYITQYQGTIVSENIIKHYPPDTTAAIFWLKNRRPDLWRDRIDHTTGGEKLPQSLIVNVVKDENAEKYKKHIERLAKLN